MRSRPGSLLGLLAALTLISGCLSHFETPEIQGRAALIDDAGRPRLWVLSKQEERRQVSIGTSGRRGTALWRTDTFFHVELQAFDPVAAAPLWKRRLFTFGDSEARGRSSSQVIGSQVRAQLLGQDGPLVWILVGDAPFALRAADGEIAANGETLQRSNPALRGLLPSEAQYYGFDRGLVLTSADARRFVIRGPEHEATPYEPPAPPKPRLKANGMPEVVPTRPPFGEVPARQVTLEGKWLGLYSEREAADAGNDVWGGKLRWPYTVIDEGRLARRSFWRAKIVTEQRFDERFERLGDLTPVANGPTFLGGRFAQDAAGQPHVLDDPSGVLVLHSTRIDDAGRLALTRLDAGLTTAWTRELPLSESDTIHPVASWRLGNRLVLVGTQQVLEKGAKRRDPYLASVDLESGEMRASKLTE